jgi:hypothetical protein
MTMNTAHRVTCHTVPGSSTYTNRREKVKSCPEYTINNVACLLSNATTINEFRIW